MFLKETLIFSCLIVLIQSHGWLDEPPPRNNKVWNVEMNCGRFPRQWQYHAGKCGICGDEYSAPQAHITSASKQWPVSRTYTSGDIVEFRYRLTAHHFGGRYEFKICPLTHLTQEVTQECLDVNPLEIVPGQRDSIPGELYRGFAFGADTLFTVKVKIPDGFSCDHCTLQWTWVTNNAEGIFPNGTRMNGVGARETFRNCADISIKRNPNAPNAVYIPKKLETTPELYQIYPDTPVVFTCAYYGAAPDRNMEPDPFLYTGSGLVCYHLDRKNQDCELCRLNCSTPDKVCPSICQCRWYGPQKINLNSTFSQTKNPNKGFE